MTDIQNSEILNQKKQFIFEVTQTSDYIFPNEIYYYYVYIKNISGVDINNFNIKIDKPETVVFREEEKPEQNILLKHNESKLYKFEVYCTTIGEHIVHFIGYGEETQILYETLKINCTRSYNNSEFLHRLSIYDFSPFEDKYSMEATNYSDQVTQTFKRQKLPYKTGQQPFSMKVSNDIENVESESFLEQYEEAKNTKEHVYQYISRENFEEDSVETYTGENLYELFDKINRNSEYFKVTPLYRNGTNELLNDFKQFAPNGLIYRLGLLSSEIYHNLGVIPSYSYMNDYLFRWAPSTEYMQTDEFKKKQEEEVIKYRELLDSFEDIETAETFIKKHQEWDEQERNNQRTNIVKYQYEIKESIYDTGVFYVNIPIDKIPSNFYLLSHEALYAIINRAKPYGMKPIINYVIERTFDQEITQKLSLNYHKRFLFDAPMTDMTYIIHKNAFIEKTETCDGESYSYVSLEPIDSIFFYNNFIFDTNHSLDVDYSNISMNNTVPLEMTQDVYGYSLEKENDLTIFKEICNLIYEENYNQISFALKGIDYSKLLVSNDNIQKTFNNDKELVINNIPIKTLKFRIANREFRKGDSEIGFILEDIMNKKYKFSIQYDTDLKKEFIKYTYINVNNEEYVKEKGYQNITGISFLIENINNKQIIFFMVEDEEKTLHYFHHILVPGLLDVNIKNFSTDSNMFNSLLYAYNIDNIPVEFETPYVLKAKTYSPKIISNESNWSNLYRFNTKDNSYAYIKNINQENLTPQDIVLHHDDINIPETATIEKIRYKIIGFNTRNKQINILNSVNTGYKIENVDGYSIQLSPSKIESYSHLKDSTTYYQIKLNDALEEGKTTYINKFTKLLNENYIFNEDINVETNDYLINPNDFISINHEFWYELSDITDLIYKLNEVKSINFIIEGYNTQYETDILAQLLFETDSSSIVKNTIPSGYFRKKIPLLYPNEFYLEDLRLRFRFKGLNHLIKIFDTKIEIEFKNKQIQEILYENENIFYPNEEQFFALDEEYISTDLINGLTTKLEFYPLAPGDSYQLNFIQLEVIYKENDIDMMINDHKYTDKFYGIEHTTISGIAQNAYISGLFYNDVITMSQNDNNISANNKGIKLQESIYQSFETRADNITGIEIYPNGFRGSPDESLKIGLYKNNNNTPGQLIKEIYVNGWVKNNKELKNLNKIKYNFVVNNLKINETYWFKIEVLNPKENNYYLLKGLNKTKGGYKLLSNENNNYINTFGCLTFNIYSKNLSQSFYDINAIQEYFDNPYIEVGLHKGQGVIKNLKTYKSVKTITEDDYMAEVFEEEIEMINVSIKAVKNGEEINIVGGE